MKGAGPAEILRAAQKDTEFIKRLQRDVREITQRVKGDAWWLQWHSRLDAAATCTYYLLTTVNGLQTLGEEYAGIIQVTEARRLPGAARRLLLAALLAFGPAALAAAVRRADGGWQRPRLAVLLQLLHQLHVTLFYLGAGYYHPEKRLAGIRYLLVRPWMGDATSRRTFLVLGAVSLLHLCISAAVQLRGIAAPDPAAPEEQAAPLDAAPVPRRLQCPLCLGRRTATAATPCGHLFCWGCAVDWLQTQPSCPVCREDTPPHRLVPLVGYDES